jgi:hypothetical protein
MYQFLIFILGFGFMYLSQENTHLQFIILVFVLTSYIVIGFLHHHLNHELKSKIVIEYVLISSLILSAFLFFNAGRI